MKNKKFYSCIIAIVVGVLTLAFDLTSKYLIEANIGLHNYGKFIPGFIGLYVDHNYGAAFSSLQGQRILLIILSVAVITFFLTWYIYTYVKAKRPMSRTLGFAVGLITGGCLGNLFDRIFFGYVRDFISLEFVDFATFNIADSALCVGLGILVIYFIFIYPRENKKEAS